MIFGANAQTTRRFPCRPVTHSGQRRHAECRATRQRPLPRPVRIAPGQQTKIFYRAQNLSAKPITGQAAYNVTPDQAGKYFNKIECFCFTEQTLAPGQSVKMPILFFIDPAILKDEDTKNIDEITLSYTFYPVETGATGR